MNKLFISMIFIALVSSCASTSEKLSSDIDGKREEAEKICQTKKIIGSRIPEKFCYTKQEFERMEEASRETLEKAQRAGERIRIQETLGNTNSSL
ncbi:hypothetical protein N9774_02845 [Gammaproteobacteria bacterium]|nr:hypothetical protein [Gammaproteobacteria bacterium]